MRIVFFNNNHQLDLDHEMIYFSAADMHVLGKETIVQLILDFNPDLIIEEEKNDGKSLYNEIYNKLDNIPKAYWLIDAHTNLIDHLVYARQFDYIFCAQSWFVPIVEHEINAKVFYLPLCHTQTLTEYDNMMKTQVDKTIDFSFIGNIRSIHVDRKKYITQLLTVYPDFFARSASYEKTLDYLRHSRVIFNCSLNNDLNFRVWEAIACEAFLITDEVTDLQHFPLLKQFMWTYDKRHADFSQSTINFAINRITKQKEFIRSKHTLTHRMEQLLVMLQSGNQYLYE